MAQSPNPKIGNCCVDMKSALEGQELQQLLVETGAPNDALEPTLQLEDNKISLSIGCVLVEDENETGNAWYDQVINFCPFCGKELNSN